VISTEHSHTVSWCSATALCATRRLGITLLAGVALILLTVGTAAADFERPPAINPYCGGSSHTSIALSSTISSTVGSSTHWSFSYSEAKGGPWTPVPGGEGTLSVENGEVKAELTGLTPEVTYYVLLTATNKVGATTKEAFDNESGKLEGCETIALRPRASIERFRAVGSSSARALGGVDPRGSETHWRFEDATKEAGPWAPAPGAEGTISRAEAEALPIDGEAPLSAELTGLKGGTVYYVRLFAENEPLPGVHKQGTSEVASFETAGPPVADTFATHALKGETLRLLGYVETNTEEGGYETHYHFEYVDQHHFEAEGGFASAETKSTPEGAGGGAVAADLPQLAAGETYHYRLTATNTTLGNPVVHGEERTLAVPSVPVVGAEASCPNEDFRVGPSANPPDCRAYEQVTPVDKEGSEEAFHYGVFNLANAGALVGEDGDHFEFDGQFVHWGSGGSPYFFSRTEHGWKMTAGTPQPEAGIDSHYIPELYNPDLTQFAFSAAWDNGVNASSNIEFKAGLPGGPYQTAVSVPRTQIAEASDGEAFESGWVAASEDLSNLILATEDRTVVPGHATGTASGKDLYEYSQGQFRQLNVAGGAPGVTIGSCGAEMAAGAGEKEFSLPIGTATRHSVSADGGHVFFYAVPSGNCSESRHLYVRTGGAETTDLGTDGLLAANAAGTEALLVARSGETEEVLLYDTESHLSTLLFSMSSEEVRPWIGGQAPGFAVSEDLGTIYVATGQHLTPEAPPTGGLYRYDVSTKALHFVLPGARVQYLSPDGRYVYFNGEVPGLGEHTFRYDSVENVIECIPCASTFDPEPKHEGEFISYESNSATRDGMPSETVASANGDYVFFDTISALVPKDVNGEILPNGNNAVGGEFVNYVFSPSSDVYEWRKPGVDGCAHVEGCVSLISSGGSGKLVMLLGTDDSGRDVFFTSAAQLGPNDNDNAIDVYDARIDGGEPPAPPRPVECEGDACSTPASPPNDATPSSFAFVGAGDILQAPSSKLVVKPAKPKKIKHRHRKKAIKGHGKAKRSSRRSR
jgi:hypothetical protein